MKTESAQPVRPSVASKRKRIRTWRMATMAAAAALVVLGAVLNAGTGSFSAFGVKDISAVCPLGYLETALAGRAIMPRLLIAFLVIAALTALLGRFFCGWICPVPLVRKALIQEDDTGRDDHSKQQSIKADAAFENATQDISKEEEQAILAKEEIAEIVPAVDRHTASGLSVLGITLASSAIFGFPVFCLVCPIGLIFATLFALIRLLHFNEPSLDLLIFPAIIVIELVFLRKWCVKWCPVGALLSLFSRLNRRLVPTVDRSRCLEGNRNVHCGMCRQACSFDIDLRKGMGKGAISECTKCRECAAVCPAQAIWFPWEPKGFDQANSGPGAGKEERKNGLESSPQGLDS